MAERKSRPARKAASKSTPRTARSTQRKSQARTATAQAATPMSAPMASGLYGKQRLIGELHDDPEIKAMGLTKAQLSKLWDKTEDRITDHLAQGDKASFGFANLEQARVMAHTGTSRQLMATPTRSLNARTKQYEGQQPQAA